MSIRVRTDGYANIRKNGELIHTNVRYMVADDGRVAVFGPGKNPPEIVYATGDVDVQRLRGCVPCKGDTPKMTLVKLWANQENASVV